MVNVIAVVLLLCLLGAWVAFPLLPAILIYRLFPNTQVAASGPLAGLTVKAGGAFAAYLIVFLIVIPLVETTKNAIGSMLRTFWEIRGEVKLVDQTGTHIERGDLITKMVLGTRPAVLGHTDQTLTLKIPEETWGVLPKIFIVIPEWGGNDIDLRSASRDHFFKQMDVGEIRITKVPPPLVHDSQAPMDTGIAAR